MLKRITTALAAVSICSLALSASAFGHASVSTMQPQGSPKAAARQLYVLRVPNETSSQDTYRVEMFVPGAVQEKISFRKVPGWKLMLTKKDTGRKDDEGAPIVAITKATWLAVPGAVIEPHFFEEFAFRFMNPDAGVKLCFPTVQYYSPLKAGDKPERVNWTGATGSARPASCQTMVA